MSWNSEQIRAIGHYADKYHLKLTICTFPEAVFISPDGQEIKRNIDIIVQEYIIDNKEEVKEKKRSKARKDREASWSQNYKLT